MALPQEVSYTHADLLDWDTNIRYELYDGRPVALASPSSTHQLISGELFRQFANYLAGKKCKVFPAPFDVSLFAEKGDRPENVFTVLQPDLSVICDPDKIDEHGCKGAPDLVIEVLSSSTARNDRLFKYRLYQRAGVREYWLVDPASRTVLVHTLEDGAYHSPIAYNTNAAVPVGILEDCTIDLSTVFPET